MVHWLRSDSGFRLPVAPFHLLILWCSPALPSRLGAWDSCATRREIMKVMHERIWLMNFITARALFRELIFSEPFLV